MCMCVCNPGPKHPATSGLVSRIVRGRESDLGRVEVLVGTPTLRGRATK